MPIYEFECEKCEKRFEELLSSAAATPACPDCGAPARRLLSPVSPSSRQPRGAAARSGESRRREGEAARQQRLGEARGKRARGEAPAAAPKKGKGS